VIRHLENFSLGTYSGDQTIYFPCPFKETEAAAALKASTVAAIADLRYGPQNRKIRINLQKTAVFLFSIYLATLSGFSKAALGAKSKLKGYRSYYP
jgi:hypothetical protein